MSWPTKYWDSVEQFYWTPKLLGLASIPKKLWHREDGLITIPAEHVPDGGSLYTRKGTAASNLERVRRLEEPLNHIFDIAFGVAPNLAIERLLAEPLGFSDPGPFLRFGREVSTRYPDMLHSDTTQQDGFFVSQRSLIGVELKIASRTSPGQVLKYVAMLAGEQHLTGRREQLGLLYVTPREDGNATFEQAKINADGSLPPEFSSLVPDQQKSAHIERILSEFSAEIADVAARLKVRHISWRELASCTRKFTDEHDTDNPGGETLNRLMTGLADAIEGQDGCIANEERDT